MLNPIQTISEEKMSADDSMASATSALACPIIPAMSLTSTSRALTSSPACAQRMLRFAVLLLTARGVVLKVDFLQTRGSCIDARGVGLCILTRDATRDDEVGTFRLIRERSIHEKVSTAPDNGRLEPIDGGHQVIELAARLAPSEEHAFLSNASGELENRRVTLLAPMRIEVFLLLLVRLLCHPASTFFGLSQLICKTRDNGVKAATFHSIRRG